MKALLPLKLLSTAAAFAFGWGDCSGPGRLLCAHLTPGKPTNACISI